MLVNDVIAPEVSWIRWKRNTPKMVAWWHNLQDTGIPQIGHPALRELSSKRYEYRLPQTNSMQQSCS
jgi:hypothetical protein